MMAKFRHPLLAGVLFGVATTIAATGGLSVAFGVVGSTTEMRACVANATGVMRLMEADDACSPVEHEVRWNKEGPPGPAGTPGTPGISDVQYRAIGFAFAQRPDGQAIVEDKSGTALCLSGERAIGGGVTSRGASVRVIDSRPELDGSGWFGAVHYDSSLGGSPEFAIYAVCAVVG